MHPNTKKPNKEGVFKIRKSKVKLYNFSGCDLITLVVHLLNFILKVCFSGLCNIALVGCNLDVQIAGM
jgi:hypothetical protein